MSWGSLVESGLVVEQVPLAPLTTYKVGGAARYFAEVADEGGLIDLASALQEHPIDVVVLGRGSNVLVADTGFPGLVVRLGAGFTWVEPGPVTTAGGATPLPRLARACAEAARAGLEFFVGIPGSVGGAVRMNAGCHGSETKDRLEQVRIVDLRHGGVRVARPEDLEFGYRRSNLADTDVVVSASWRTEAGERPDIERTLREITRWRKEHQPGGTRNAGSVFKNPPGESAGRLIDHCGLKGLSVGGATVSSVHANFIEAEGATASDIYGLIRTVQQQVLERAGVKLEPEVRLIGAF